MEERSGHDEKDNKPSDELQSPEAGTPLRAVDSQGVDDDKAKAGSTRKNYGLIVILVFVSALLGGLVATVAVPYMYGSTPEAVYSGRSGSPASGPREIINVEKGEVSPVTAVAKKLQPSIANIRIRQSVRDMFHPEIVSGVGSGVIFRQDGYILTNNHVVSGAREILVTIGTEEIRAKLVAADKETDLAVLKVERTGLPAVELGSTKDLQVGELAVAIGSPFGFEHTVTSGIISALNRTVSIPGEGGGRSVTYTNLIQTDAPINPGNSGGALSDAQGRLIGINTLIISSSGVTEGLGFAIPVETVKSVAEQLIEKGRASHPYMGILGSNVSDVVANDANLGTKQGAIVRDVEQGSPADKAGLKKQDIIIAIDGKSIGGMDELISEIRNRKVGDTVGITYLRGTKRDEVKLTLVEKPRQ